MAGDEHTLTPQDEVLDAPASTSTAGQLEGKKDDTKSTEDTSKDSETSKESATDEKTSEASPKPEGESKPAAPPLLVPQTHQTYINFLFLSGRRKLMHFEPDTTIGRVKELVWAAWSTPTSPGAANADAQIEEQPPAPAYIRVLYLGRMLQDDETLRDLKLPTHLPSSSPTPGGSHHHAPVSTIMHLSIRPFPPPAEDTGKKVNRGFGRAGTETDPGDNANTGCCGCVIC
ncbi:hypothetical protein MD484_g6240, partial [Candolleomyces efflorescens]